MTFEKFLFTERLRTTASYCSNLSKLASNFLKISFQSFEPRLTFYWKRHYSICIPKNWNILIWFVCHPIEYLKLKRIDSRHFWGKRSVLILKIIHFLSKWFLEYSDLASTFTKKTIFIVEVFVVIFVWATFLFAWKIVCVFKWCRVLFRTISNIFQT